MSSSSLDYLELCRLCLVKDRVQAPIFEEDGDVNQIFLKIHACLPVKVSRDDKLPKKICDDCLYNVNAFYQFWNTTANAEKQLLQWLGEVEGLEDKQGYVTEVLDSNVMKQEHGSDNRLDGSVMQVSGHQNMGINMIENMSIITMPAGSEHQFTTVPIDTGGTVQTVQVSGPSTQTAHDQTGVTHLQEVEVDDDEDNMDDGCDNDDGLPVKEETDEGERSLEQTYVSLPCDEAGPSGLQQQKISEMSEITIQQTADGDPKTGSLNFIAPPIKRCVIDESGNEHEAVVSDSEIIPKTDDECEEQEDNNDEDFRLVDEENDDDFEEEKEPIDYFPSDNDFEDFDDFEEVSIDGSCSTVKPSPPSSTDKKSAVDIRIVPKFEPINVDYGTSSKSDPDATTTSAIPGVIFMCKTCQIYFPLRRMLETHMSTIHDESRKTKVDRWAERNARAGYIKLEDGTYSCRYCDYKAPGRTTVSTHVGRKHGRRRSGGNNHRPKEPKEKKKGPKPKAESSTDDPLIYITKVVMTVDNLKSQPEPEPDEPQELDATSMATNDDVPEALAEEEVVEGETSHVRRMCEYSCPYCRFETRRRADMHAHITEKHNEAWYESVAQQEAEREQNKRKDTFDPVDGRHHCQYCSFSATSRPTLNAHTRRKHKGVVQPYRQRRLAPVEFHCDQCDFKTMYRHKIQSHIERRHVAEPRYNCEYCGRKYKTKSDLTSHMRFQHFHQPLVCEVCGKVCSNSNALHIHKKREHFKPEFECKTCHRRMVSQANLDEHVQRQHTDKITYMCEQCGKVFDQPCKLKQHTMTHTGERPNICHICGKAFARRAVFRQHLLIHSGERPYVCDICGKAFTQKPGLICHRKSHPGEKPPLPVVYIDSILDKFLSKS